MEEIDKDDEIRRNQKRRNHFMKVLKSTATYRSPIGLFCHFFWSELFSCRLRVFAACYQFGVDMRNQRGHECFNRIMDGTPVLICNHPLLLFSLLFFSSWIIYSKSNLTFSRLSSWTIFISPTVNSSKILLKTSQLKPQPQFQPHHSKLF